MRLPILIQKTGLLLNIGSKFNCIYAVIICFCTVARFFPGEYVASQNRSARLAKRFVMRQVL